VEPGPSRGAASGSCGHSTEGLPALAAMARPASSDGCSEHCGHRCWAAPAPGKVLGAAGGPRRPRPRHRSCAGATAPSLPLPICDEPRTSGPQLLLPAHVPARNSLRPQERSAGWLSCRGSLAPWGAGDRAALRLWGTAGGWGKGPGQGPAAPRGAPCRRRGAPCWRQGA